MAVPPDQFKAAEARSKVLGTPPIFGDFIAASYQNHLRLTAGLIAEGARATNK